MHPSKSGIDGIVSGVVLNRPSSLLRPVRVEERFAAEPGGGAVVRWSFNISAVDDAATTPAVFGSESLDSWLTLGGELGVHNSMLWAAYGDTVPYAPGGYTEPFAARNFR
jgi:hypothetical protein